MNIAATCESFIGWVWCQMVGVIAVNFNELQSIIIFILHSLNILHQCHLMVLLPQSISHKIIHPNVQIILPTELKCEVLGRVLSPENDLVLLPRAYIEVQNEHHIRVIAMRDVADSNILTVILVLGLILQVVTGLHQIAIELVEAEFFLAGRLADIRRLEGLKGPLLPI